MNQVHHLASALLTIVFAGVVFVLGHLYTAKSSMRVPTLPTIAQALMLSTNPL
jgi:hypothetical protein